MGRTEKTSKFGRFEVDKPQIVFHCEWGVFAIGGDNSYCYCTSKERAEWIAKRLALADEAEKARKAVVR